MVLMHWIGRVVVRSASAVVVLVVVAGVPAGLAYFVGWPLPDRFPGSVDDVAALLARDFDDAAVVKVLAVALWLVWAAFCRALAVEVQAVRRGRASRRLRLISPVQALAAMLVAGLAAGPSVTLAAAAATPGSVVSATAAATTYALYAAPQPMATWSEAPTGTAAGTSHPAGPAAPSKARPATAGVQDLPRFAVAAADGPITVATAGRQYTATVQRGDTLWEIAQVWLGNPHRWVEIYDLNKARYDRHGRMRGGHHIEPTWVLTLPDDAHPPAGARPAAPIHPKPPPAPRTTPPPPPTSAAPSQPADRQEPDGVVEPHQPPATSPPSSPTTASPAPPAAAERPSHRSSNDTGVAIPNGWVTIGLAAALAAAAAVVWLRRRHRYNPHTAPDPASDPTLQPLPATVTRLRREVRRQAPHLLEPPNPGPTVREYAQLDPKPPLPEPGPHGPELAGWGPLPAGGLGLTGPGAAGAARAMLVASLSAGHAFDPDAEATVVVPASVLADLVGGHAVVDLVGSIPRLIVTPGLSEAVTHLHRENLDRAWILDQHDAQNLTELHTRFPDHEPLPPMLLIADTPEQAKRGRLSTVLELSHGMGIGAVLLGDWPAGTTVHVAPDGSTTGGDGQRLSTLDQPTTTDSLAVLREAHTGEPPEPVAAVHPPASAAIGGTGTPAPPAPTAAAAPQGQSGTTDQPRGDLDDPAAANDAPEAGDQDHTTDPSNAGSPPPPPDSSGRSPDVPAGAIVPVQVRVLGRVAILKPDGTAVAGLRRKAAELLLYLAAHRGGAAIDDIKEALWPDAPMSRAKERLATDVANLRASLRAGARITAQQAEPDATGPRKPRGGKKPVGPEFVLNPGGRYILAPDLVDVDWWRVGDAVAEASTAADTPARQAALERAVAAFGGLLYDADGTYEWANVEVEVSRRHGVTAHTQLAELVGPDHPEQAAGYLQRAADLDPINEDLAVAAMRAHAAAGDIDAIRARSSRLSRALLDTGQEPAEQTSALATQLCRDVAARGPRTRPGDMPPTDKPHP